MNSNLALTAHLLAWIHRIGPDAFSGDDFDPHGTPTLFAPEDLSLADAVEVSTLVELALERGINVRSLVEAVRRAKRDAN